MDSSRQVVRWSIPGSVALLLIGLFELVHVVAYRDAGLLTTVAGVNPVVAAGVIVAGIPLGFVMDQIYYATFGRVAPGDYVAYDRGAAALRALPDEVRERLRSRAGIASLDVEEMTKPGLLKLPRLEPVYRSPAQRKRYEERHRRYRTLMQFAVMTLEDGADSFKAEYTSLSDVYHSLGSTRISILIAAAAFLVLHVVHWWFMGHRWPTALTAFTYLVIVLLAAAIFAAVELARRGTNETLQQFLAFALRTYPLGVPTDRVGPPDQPVVVPPADVALTAET